MAPSPLVWGAFALSTFGLSSNAADLRDLQRAKAKVPRAEWKGKNFNSMSDVLNGHLKKMFPVTKPCEEWSAEDLQTYQELLYGYKHDGFDSIYAGSKDNRRMRHKSLDDHKQQWKSSLELLKSHTHLREMHRDGHCHEAVMWLVHHTPSAEQHSVFARLPVPLLSPSRHSCNATSVQGEQELCKLYDMQVSCADCHSGTGIIAQDFDDIEGRIPEDPKLPGMNIQRRCDANWKPACGPCDGIGGPYWGDKVSEFQPTNCEVVALPDDVPESERPAAQFPEQFIVHQLGSDRLARTQNAAKYALYSQIRSTLWYDFPLNGESNGTATPDGIARLRHDTFYDDQLYKHLDNGLVSEIHTQTREQRANNVTGPMVSLIHSLLGYGKYTGGCTCLADPVGVPVLGGIVDNLKAPHSSFTLGADYKGRIKIGVEYDGYKLGDKGHGDMTKKRNMTVDHYMKWFLHLFIDADKESPTYGQPVRFYGPYSGFAVYVSVNKTAPPAEVWDTACVDNGWRDDEFKPLHPCTGHKISEYSCMNVEKKHPEVCKPYEGKQSSPAAEGSMLTGNFGSLFIPDKIPETEIVV